MTKEQIKQTAILANVPNKVENALDFRVGFIAGAQSMLEEIKQFEWEKKHYQDIAWQLAAENEQLRNPWIDLKDKLPEDNEEVLFTMEKPRAQDIIMQKVVISLTLTE